VSALVTLDGVGVTHAGADRPVLSGVDLAFDEGEFVLVAGPTGSGKSTLLGTLNGLVPHATGGTLHGRVIVAGRNTAAFPPRELSDVVGWVGQDPAAGFVTDTVEEELAYGMESLGVAPPTMRRRVEETLDLLGLADLRSRQLSTLSGGQAQRVAVGSVLTVHPKVVVLDEPTSALDPTAAEDVLAALARLVADLGLTVVVAEHRLERVAHHADRMVLVPGDGAPVVVGSPARLLPGSTVAPPVVRLGRAVGWAPPPLTVRDARRLAGPLRDRLGPPPPALPPAPTPVTADVARASVRRGAVRALDGVDLELRAGTVTAVMGRNGAGKSTLLSLLAGMLRPDRGAVRLGGSVDPARLRTREVLRHVAMVPQDPGHLLYAETVAAECRAADADAARANSSVASGTAAGLLAALAPGVPADRHPRDLSEGQRLALALAIVLAAAPPLLLLDEPTRGLDQAAKAWLVVALRRLAADGRTVVLATHDVELAAEVADRVVVLADGEVVVDGPVAEVVTSSPAFAPQVARVLAPARWLTVGQVAAALGERRETG
jgi:energy-coupling factor transporter ATP-binding protein EcfA2